MKKKWDRTSLWNSARWAKNRMGCSNYAHKKRLEWLLKYPQFWQPYRLNKKTVYCLFGMMQVAGLYSYKTNWFDCSIVGLVYLARKRLKGIVKASVR